ncbi:hypothetical protein QQ045_018746 [Rhodiola kirilowii]
MATIDNLYKNGVEKVPGEAKAIGKALKKFNFVYCLLLMHEVMKITGILSQTFQKKDMDILNAMQFLSMAKVKLQSMRDDSWDSLIMKIETFCFEHGISMPDMSAPYKKGVRDNERNITNEHYFRVNVLYAVIDFQLMELENRFPETSIELLALSASFHRRNDFQAFKKALVEPLGSTVSSPSLGPPVGGLSRPLGSLMAAPCPSQPPDSGGQQKSAPQAPAISSPATAARSFVAVTKSPSLGRFLPIHLAARQYGSKDGKPAITFTSSELQAGVDNLKHSLVAKFAPGRPHIDEIRKTLLAA